MKKIYYLLLFVFIVINTSLCAQTTWYNVCDFGAKGDGQTLDTKAIT